MPKPPPRRVPAPHTVDFIGSFPGRPPVATAPEVAFAGRSNVGKSSAINAVLGHSGAARVSKTPGRTQAINLFDVQHAKARFTLVDLPGYGFAKVPEDVQQRWKGAIERYLADRAALRLVVVLVDARHPPQKLDLDLIRGLQLAQIPCQVVATKYDKLPRSKAKGMLRKLGQGLGQQDIVGFSSLDRTGVDELRARLLRVVRPGLSDDEAG
jgi:GTP-binding protein